MSMAQNSVPQRLRLELRRGRLGGRHIQIVVSAQVVRQVIGGNATEPEHPALQAAVVSVDILDVEGPKNP